MSPSRCWPRRLAGAVVLACVACRAQRDTLTVAGTIEIRQVQLAPLAAGRLRRLYRDEGDTVRVGDTVAVLDQPGLTELIDQRVAQAGAARQRTSDVTAALVDSARAANDLARAERLRASDVISIQQYDQIRSAAAAAAARLQSVRAAPRESEAARAAVAATRAIRDELTLIAPADGIVLTRYAEAGEAVAAGAPIISIGLVREPWVRAYVGELFIARLRVGQQVAIRVDGYADTAFAGTVVEIAPRAEFTPRVALTERERADLVFAIRIAIDDAGGRLKAGMPVEIDIPLLP